MKVLFAAIVALMALAAVSADCGCLKCSKNLYVASPPSAPLKVIYRGATCSCNREIPYAIQKPIMQTKPMIYRDHTYKCTPLRIVKKTVQVPLYSYDYQVQVPVEQKRCNKCLVGLVAQPDRVVLPAPSCREPASSAPSRGPVFEALSTTDDEDYIYQYPVKKCSCGRYNNFLPSNSRKMPKIGPRYHDGYRELTEQEIEDNINKNIKDVFFENTLQGRLRRFIFSGLSNLQVPKKDESCVNFSNFSIGLGKIKFCEPRTFSDTLLRAKRSLSDPAIKKSKLHRTKRALLPFLAPQRSASLRISPASKIEDATSKSSEMCAKKKRSLDDLAFTFEEDNEIPHGHDESYEVHNSEEIYDSVETKEDHMVSMPKASNLLLDTLHVDQFLPQIPLLFFVNAPISMLAHFHRINKHFEPVVQSVPTVIRTSGKYFTDFGNRFKKSFYVFTNCLMSSFDDAGRRMKRSAPLQNSLESFKVVKCQINKDGYVDFILFNEKTSTKFKDIALVIENFTVDAKEAEDVKMYLAKVDTTSLNKKDRVRRKRDIFEMDLNGDIQDLIKEKWGHLAEDHLDNHHEKSAEAIFEDHFNQVPKLYDALKQNSKTPQKNAKNKKSNSYKVRKDPILGAVRSTSKKKHEDFSDLHPEKNLDIIKQETSSVLGRLQDLLQTDIDKDLKFYEDLVKLQYLKNTLVIDWKKHFSGDKGQIVSAKMNILNYVKELEKFRAALTKKDLGFLLVQNGDVYNRSDLIKFLVELYKLQMIFTRIHEDLNDKIRLGSRFNQQNEDAFIRQLEKVQFVEKTNKFELEHHLKKMRDTKVEYNMKFLEKLRKLTELDESLEMEHDEREEVHNVARMIKENAHYKQQELQQVKEISSKAKLNQTYRKELKNLWDLEKHILENEKSLIKVSEESVSSHQVGEEVVESASKEADSLEKLDVLKMSKPITIQPLEFKHWAELKPNLEWEKDIKNKIDEFTKDIENKRKAWIKKTKKLAEIMKEP